MPHQSMVHHQMTYLHLSHSDRVMAAKPNPIMFQCGEISSPCLENVPNPTYLNTEKFSTVEIEAAIKEWVLIMLSRPQYYDAMFQPNLIMFHSRQFVHLVWRVYQTLTI
jgi:hypothetical protein